jgi:excisionase family DNA binding protein
MGIMDKNGAAAYLATSTRRVDELRRAGRLLAVLDGREWKFRVSDLDDYVESLPLSVEV